MSLEDLLAERLLRPHTTSSQEVVQLLAVCQRDLQDAALPELSPDRRFVTAYNAALQAATAALACRGYRASATAHHQTVISAIPLAMGKQFQDLSEYLNRCRRKRNAADYDRVGGVSDEEVDELLREAGNFISDVRLWISDNYPKLVAARDK